MSVPTTISTISTQVAYLTTENNVAFVSGRSYCFNISSLYFSGKSVQFGFKFAFLVVRGPFTAIVKRRTGHSRLYFLIHHCPSSRSTVDSVSLYTITFSFASNSHQVTNSTSADKHHGKLLIFLTQDICPTTAPHKRKGMQANTR